MANTKIKVLVVDDEKIIRDFFGRLLSLQGLEVIEAEDGYKASELAKGNKFDLYFIDVRMPGMDVFETFRQIRQIHPEALVVMMSFFFSSRRRHTRLVSDWSSDVSLPILRSVGFIKSFASPYVNFMRIIFSSER